MSAALKVQSVVAAILISATVFSLPSDGNPDAKAVDAAITELPKSEWDFSILNASNSTFPRYAVGAGFSVFFAGSANAPAALKLQANSGESISMAPRPLANSTKALETVRAALVEKNDTRATYEDAWGDGAGLSYEVGLGGVKESIVLDSRPDGKGDLFIPSVLTFDQNVLTPRVNGSNFTGYAPWGGDIVFVNATGVEHFRVPRAFVHDAGVKGGGGRTTLWLDYFIERRGGELSVAIVVPADFLDNVSTRYPITVDPTITLSGDYSESHTYDGYDEGYVINVPSSLNLLSGSYLKINNTTMNIQGDLGLTVSSGATFVIENSTVLTDDSAHRIDFDVSGTLTVSRSVIMNLSNGIEIWPSAPISFQSSWIGNSDGDGISILQDTSSGFIVNNTTVQNVSGAGLRVNTGGQAHATVTNSGILEAAQGIRVESSTIGLLADGVTVQNISSAAVSLDHATASLERLSIRNGSRAFEAGNSTLYAGNSTVREVGVGTWCADSTVYLDQVNIFRITGTGHSATNCAAIWTDGNYYAWSRALSSSSIEVRHRLDILLLNATDAPLSLTSILFYDALGASGAPSGVTNSGGWLNGTIVKEFTLSSGGIYSFKSPHRIDVAITGTPSVHYYVGGRRALTIHATSDADADGLSNTWEDRPDNATWIEAEYKMGADDQRASDLRASGDAAIQAMANGSYFTSLGWPVLNPGTYQFLVRAAGNGLGASFNLSAADSFGNSILSAENHPMAADYSWVASKPFVVASPKSVMLNATAVVPDNSTPLMGSAVLVDKVAIVRMKDIAGVSVGYAGAQMSDPLDNDTDFDGLNDGNESSSGRAWYEAEVLAPTAPRDLSDLAASGVGIEHPSGTAEVLNSTLFRFSYFSGSKYQLYARLRSLSAGLANATLTLKDGAGLASANVSVGADWQWVAGPLLTAGGGSPLLTAIVKDLDDGNLNDASGAIALDEVAVLNSSSYASQDGWFNASSPMDPDADRDGVADGPEIQGFFPAEILQAEDYTSAYMVTPLPNGLEFNNSAAWANYSFPVRYAGEYRFLIEPLVEVNDCGAALPYSDLRDLLIADVRDANQGAVSAIAAGLAAFQYSNISSNVNGMNQVGTFYDGRFNFTVGNYTIKLYINITKAATLYTHGCVWRLAYDKIYLQKFRLNVTTWDVDADLVPDGYEVNQSMLPLRSDSDYDSLLDFEEIHTGADGFVTSPTSNDTDRDGVLDAVEVGGYGDDDNQTRTDPTAPDTDGDGLPDGWVDGWTWNATSLHYEYRWGARDGIRQPWEGEDLDGNGAVNTTAFALGNFTESVGGETDPNSTDTDNDTMDDSWEVLPRMGMGYAQLLDPRTDDAQDSPDNDDLPNFEEYAGYTDPFNPDTDADGIRDGDEVRVMLRTSIMFGAANTSGYAAAAAGDWILYDTNPYDGADGAKYSFANATADPLADSYFAPNQTRWIRVLADGGMILYSESHDEIVVWDYDADAFDADSDGILEGTVYNFSRNESATAQTGERAVIGYHWREVVGPVDANDQDSDGDGIWDSKEGFTESCGIVPCTWAIDYDADGFPAAADGDSDGDGLADGAEDVNRNGIVEPEAGETASYAADTDDDGLSDGADEMPQDQDNDGLLGYGYHSQSNPDWSVQEFYGQERCPGREHNTSYTNPDTDGDWVLDGHEDANHNCVMEANETNPYDADTDDDGLWDGPLVRIDAGNLTVPVFNHYSGQEVANLTVDGVQTLDFAEPQWYEETASASYSLSNLTSRQYLVTVDITDYDHAMNVTRTFHVRIDNQTWWATSVHVDSVWPNWSTVLLGHILVPANGTHNLTIESDRGGFLMARLNLTPIILGEWWYGTWPRNLDSDGDGLMDGAEVGVTPATAAGSCQTLYATDTCFLWGNTNGFWSVPTIADTDRDGLVDGNLSRNNVQYGEYVYHSNPASVDTDGDRLGDWTEIFSLHSSPIDPDTDGDWLPDSYEPIPSSMIDDDNVPAILDNDTDTTTYAKSDYNSTEQWGSGQNTVNRALTVVFRTNVVRGEYWRSGVWVAANVTNGTSLSPYVFEANMTNVSGYTEVTFQTHVVPDGGDLSGWWYDYPVTTFEGFGVYANATHLAIRVSATLSYRFRAWTANDGGAPALDPLPSLHNASDSNFKWRETLNWSAVFFNIDFDHDGLNSTQENALGLDPGDPDFEDDGMIDGEEVNGYFDPISGRTYFGNPHVKDSDGDNLTDGVEIRGWANGTSSDPSNVDTDNDGAWDGNFTWGHSGPGNFTNWSYGEWSNGTNPLLQDTDGDEIPDGWELSFGFNASNPMDAVFDDDWDLADNWAEYYWGQNESNPEWDGLNDSWIEAVSGVWWNGTNPLLFDTDNDTMPDGWEMTFRLEPRSNSDWHQDLDADSAQNWEEYAWSIVDHSWNYSRAWDTELSADPRNNDTDGDGLADGLELCDPLIVDLDQDGIPSAVDFDSDGDQLPDFIEVGGWEVGTADVAQTHAFLEDGGSSEDFTWYNVTSDPFDRDSDNDSVDDFGEYQNGSNPQLTDTDGDYVNDSQDYVTNASGGRMSTSVMQDVEGPQILWTAPPHDGDCSAQIGQYQFKIACTNISFYLSDPNGLGSVTFTHLGLGIVQTYEDHLIAMRMELDSSGTSAYGWIFMPLRAASEYEGQYKILVSATDKLGNTNQRIVLGGNIYNKWHNYLYDVNTASFEQIRTGEKAAACAAALLIPGLSPVQASIVCVAEKARDFGWHYGFDMAAHDGGQWIRDPFSTDGTISVQHAPACDDNCQRQHRRERAADLINWTRRNGGLCPSGAFGYAPSDLNVDEWVDFVGGVGPALDPFTPTFEDQVNLSNEAGMISLYCQVKRDAANASFFAIWLKAFYDGWKDGGGAYELLMLAVNIATMLPALPFAAVGRALTGLLTNVAKEAAIAGASKLALTETVMTAKAAVTTAEAATTLADAARVGRAVSKEATEILVKEGGSVPKAVRASEGMTEKLSAEVAQGEIAAVDGEIEMVGNAVKSGWTRRLQDLKSLYPELDNAENAKAFDLAASKGIRTNFKQFAARFNNPAFKADVEGFIKEMEVDLKLPPQDIDYAFGITKPKQLSQFLGEQAMVANGGVDASLIDTARTVTGRELSEIGGKGRAYIDALVRTEPPKIWEAKFYNWKTFQGKFQSLWKSGKTGGEQIQKLLRDRELYAATDEVFGAENRVLFLRADTYDSFVAELEARGAADGKAAANAVFNKIGWSVQRLPDVDVAQAGRALGIPGVA